jgi:hypothetical protein
VTDRNFINSCSLNNNNVIYSCTPSVRFPIAIQVNIFNNFPFPLTRFITYYLNILATQRETKIMNILAMLLLQLFGVPYECLLFLSISFITTIQMPSVCIFSGWQKKFEAIHGESKSEFCTFQSLSLDKTREDNSRQFERADLSA